MADASWTSWIQAATAVGTLLTTIALAVLTGLYLRETRQLVHYSRAHTQPVLIGRVEPFRVQYAVFVVTNIGAGAARDVFLQLEAGPSKTTWNHVVFEPGRSERFLLPRAHGAGETGDLFTTLAAAGSHLIATLKYTNASGERVEADIPEVNFAGLVEQWASARWQLPESEIFNVGQQVQDKLNAIADAIEHGFESISSEEGP